MARLYIVTPARPGARTGNLHTAQRWARLLRGGGHRVEVGTTWSGQPCDALIALHARRSHEAVLAWRRARPSGGLAVVLTGTDLYKDLPSSKQAWTSLELADRIVVLQDHAPTLLPARLRRKTDVVFQSATARLRPSPPAHRYRVCVVGHLREEKDPFRAAAALASLPATVPVELVQVGGALSPAMEAQARQWVARDRRYRWTGSVTHARALRWMASSHLLVVSSLMDGGANVISEAARIGTPVLASRMSGNLGMLGRRYPGFYPVGYEKALSLLLRRAATDPDWRRELALALRARRPLFAPSAERRSLLGVVNRLTSGVR